MSDTLSNIYPIPVEFVDGQQPTARFFNSWADQIDNSFALLADIVGDFDGVGEAEDTFVPNIIRALGNQGWIGSRLPAGLRIPLGGGPGSNLPYIEEKLTAFAGKKEALLAFTPYPSEANSAGITVHNLGTPVAKGSPVVGGPLASPSSRVILDGRRLLTNVPIPSDAYIIYPIDTASDSFSENMGPTTGSNVIPSLQDVMRPPLGSPTTSYLCKISKPPGYGPLEYKLAFPEIQDIVNPLVSHSLDQSDVIKTQAVHSLIKWNETGTNTAPKYRIPQIIREVTVGTIIPSGLCALWYRGAPSAILRVRNPLSKYVITWELLASDNEVKITVPDDLTLPSYPGDPGFASYIVGFAGTSVAEAVRHNTSKIIAHSHDGREGSQVSTFHLKDGFNPDEFTGSAISHNHFPQYLLREGYEDTVTDFRNGDNAMLGPIMMGRSTIGASNPRFPTTSPGESSHPIKFGYSLGPSLFFDGDDLVDNDGSGEEEKLILGNSSLRINQGKLWLGEASTDGEVSLLASDTGDELVKLGVLTGDGGYNTELLAGVLTARSGILRFNKYDGIVDSEIFYSKDNDDALFPYTWYLNNIDGNEAKTKLIVGSIVASGPIVAEGTLTSEGVITGDITGGPGSTITINHIVARTISMDLAGTLDIKIPMGEWIINNGSWKMPFIFQPSPGPFEGITAPPFIGPYSIDDGEVESLSLVAQIPSNPLQSPFQLAEDRAVFIERIFFTFGVSAAAGPENSVYDYSCGLIGIPYYLAIQTPEILQEDKVEGLAFPGGSPSNGVYESTHTLILDPPLRILVNLQLNEYFYATFKIVRKSFWRSEKFFLKGLIVRYRFESE